jgi:hypothetical protein
MSPRLVNLSLFLTLLSTPAARAAEPATEEKPPAYTLKNKSVFNPPSDAQRAPFWPIGWTKRQPLQVATTTTAVRVVEAPKVVLDPNSFKITSILVGSPSLAIINGRTYSEGEFLRTPRAAVAAAGVAGAPAPRIRIYRINDGSVVLQCQEQLVTAMLQRPELAQRKNEELLLVEDRP